MVMMAALVAAAAVVLLSFGFLRGQYEPVLLDRRARWLLRAALVLMAAFAGFWAFFGIGEMAGGDGSGVVHLVPAVIIVLLMFAVWRRPLEGGVVFLVIGTLVTVSAFGAYRGGWPRYIMIALVTGVPLIAAGILLLLATAAGSKRKAPTDRAPGP
jgi:4-amino-4-deoxy-L-arabinose transferase-like glycosyltransferase